MIVLHKIPDSDDEHTISSVEFSIDDRGITLDQLCEEIDYFIKAIGFHPPQDTTLGYYHD